MSYACPCGHRTPMKCFQVLRCVLFFLLRLNLTHPRLDPLSIMANGGQKASEPSSCSFLSSMYRRLKTLGNRILNLYFFSSSLSSLSSPFVSLTSLYGRPA